MFLVAEHDIDGLRKLSDALSKIPVSSSNQHEDDLIDTIHLLAHNIVYSEWTFRAVAKSLRYLQRHVPSDGDLVGTPLAQVSPYYLPEQQLIVHRCK